MWGPLPEIDDDKATPPASLIIFNHALDDYWGTQIQIFPDSEL